VKFRIPLHICVIVQAYIIAQGRATRSRKIGSPMVEPED
jgi:hypothetical protein